MWDVPAPAVPALAVTLTFCCVSAMIVSARLYTRIFLVRNPGLDDWFMLAALAVSIIFSIVVCFQVKYGLGTPFLDVPNENKPKFFQTLWATIPMYNLSLVLTKISIVFQYTRVFTQAKIVRICHIMIGILCVYGLWTLFGSFFMCIPVAAFWDQSIEGHCMDRLAFWFSNSALNIVTDIMIFALPIPLLKKLQLPRRQKMGLMFVFTFGAFVCITSIIRLKSLYEISTSTDTTLDGVSTAIWSGIEINVAISCASLSTLKPFIGRIFPTLLSRGSSNTGSKTNQTSGPYVTSYTLGNISTKSKTGKNDITVVQTVVQKHDTASHSRDGSERSLVWKSECYSEETKAKSMRETV